MTERKRKTGYEKNTGRPGPGASAALFFLCLAFYCAFALIDGPRLFPDSQSYISTGITREPLYPLFLRLLYRIQDAAGYAEQAGASAPAPYLFCAAFLQSVLAAFAAWRLGRHMAGLMHDAVCAKVMLFLSPATLFGVALLNRFAAGRGAAYHVSILTEGISFSLFVLFVLRCHSFFEAACRRAGKGAEVWRGGRAVRARDGAFLKEAFLLWLDLFLLLSLRKQLTVCALTVCAAAFVLAVLRKAGWKRMLFSAGIAVLALICSTGFDLAYNRVLRGQWMQHTGNSEGMCCTLLYTAKREDAARFDDPEEQALFLRVYEKAFGMGCLYANLAETEPESGVLGTPGWEKTTTHYADHYDVIGYEVLHPVLQEYARGRGRDGSDIELAREVDRLEGVLVKGLIRQDLSLYIRLWLLNFAKGLVNTVLRMQRVLNAAAAALYVCFLLLWGSLLRRGRAGRLAAMAGIVLLGILINAAAAGAVIFPQPRYMIYSMPLFYSVLAGLFLENFV